ncbi:hypothetical protein C2G38_2056458, partial [Gigaspora rosea]
FFVTWNRHQVVVKSGADVIIGVTIFIVSSVWRYSLVFGFVEVCCMYLLRQALFFFLFF